MYGETMAKPKRVRKSWKRPRGRPRQAVTQKLNEVYELLPENGLRIKVKEIKNRADERKIGYDTLYNYLNLLEKTGQIAREVDSSTRPPTVYYRRLEDKFSPLPKYLDATFKGYLHTLEQMLKSEPSEIRDTNIRCYLSASLLAISRTVIYALQNLPENIDPAEYLDVVFRLHIRPLLARIASLSKKTGGIQKNDLENVQGALMGLMRKVLRDVKDLSVSARPNEKPRR